MSTATMFARLLLAVVFAVAGSAKLVNPEAVATAVREFGVPRVLVRPVARALPVIELALAISLVVAATALWAGIASIVLLALFTSAMAISLARGRRPDCRCFGQVQSSPIGARSVIRNVFLAGVAGFVVWSTAQYGALGIGEWLSRLTAIQLVVGGCVTGFVALESVQVWFLLNLAREQGRLHLRLDALDQAAASNTPERAGAGPAIGSAAPEFELPGLFGETLTLQSLRAEGRPVLLVFSDPHCGPCAQLMPAIAQWQDEHTDALTIAIVSRGDPTENRNKAAADGVRRVLIQHDNEVADRFSVSGTPTGVLVRADGTIGAPLAPGPDAISALVASATRPRPADPPPAPAIGTTAPGFELPDIEGTPTALHRFRGRQLLLLFWNPHCRFCALMLEDLRAWESTGFVAAPQLVVISTGSLAENRALNLSSPVLSDPDNSVAARFGARGTPMALLVSPIGTIESGLAAGAEAVFDLVRNLPLTSSKVRRT
ncbi:MauE/DoxX family redox-associated membrane protein [Smaragdicoccus niigatensis]|uniref:MauE/DoxX family redox-associated membrane protein n=1 Tax=Smaragdicoccus niigatensis TaxID=359359 RepID=UPI00038285F7|nr:MauE/DoxX family redox-associated membrane protein [Smaragdicoccus niigatensis]